MVRAVSGDGGNGFIDGYPGLKVRLSRRVSGVGGFGNDWERFAGAMRSISIFIMKAGWSRLTMTRS